MKLSRTLLPFALAVAIPASAAAEVKRYALVIGNNTPARGDRDMEPLSYADDDAVRYYQMTKRLGADSLLLSVLDRDTQRRYPRLPTQVRPPTTANLKKAVAALARKISRDVERGDEPVFYFVFAGHGGVSKGTSYLALLDGKITQRVLYDQILSKVPAHTSHVIIDACHATGVVGSRGMFDKEAHAQSWKLSADQLADLEKLKHYPHVGILAATTAGEEAHEWNRIESGVFSHEVLSGLSGAADINRDGAVEYSEIQAFVSAANRDVKDRRAAPRVIAIPPASNDHAPLAVLAKENGVAWLEGNPSALGHFHVELERGQRYLDAHLAANEPVRIAIPANEPLFVRTRSKEAHVSAQDGEVIKFAQLSFDKRKLTARGSFASEFQRNLFASAFGQNYYQGFVDSTGVAPVSFQGSSSEKTDRRANKKAIAIGFLATSSAAVAATAVAGAMMIKAKRDADNATSELQANEAQSRYRTARAVSIGSAALAVAAGITTGLLWPKKKVDVSVAVDPKRKSYAVGARLQF